MIGRLPRLAAGLVLALCLAAPLAACGKKGPPAVPKGETNIYPQAYPKDTTEPTKAPDPSAFPAIEQPNTNIDPTQPRSLD